MSRHWCFARSLDPHHSVSFNAGSMLTSISTSTMALLDFDFYDLTTCTMPQKILRRPCERDHRPTPRPQVDIDCVEGGQSHWLRPQCLFEGWLPRIW